MRKAIVLLLSVVSLSAPAQTQLMRLSQKQGQAASYATSAIDSVTMDNPERLTVWRHADTPAVYP